MEAQVNTRFHSAANCDECDHPDQFPFPDIPCVAQVLLQLYSGPFPVGPSWGNLLLNVALLGGQFFCRKFHAHHFRLRQGSFSVLLLFLFLCYTRVVFFPLFFTWMKDVPNSKIHIGCKDNSAEDKKSTTHVVLLWRIANANNRIVPGQCAEYNASSYLPRRPNVTEYIMQINASMTGYHFKTNNLTVLIFCQM